MLALQSQMSTMSTAQQEKEKVRIALEASEIPATEVEDLISETSGLWAKSTKEGSNLWYIPVKLVERISPTFLFSLKSKLETEVPDRANKKVSFTMKIKEDNYLFGLNETDQDGKAQDEMRMTIWRVKQNPASSFGSGTGGASRGFPPQPLAELFIGSIVECNTLLKDESKKWYLVHQEIHIDPNTQMPAVYVILKRNRYTGAPPPAST